MRDNRDRLTLLAANPRARSRGIGGRGLDEGGNVKGRCREAAVQDSRGGMRDGKEGERKGEGTHVVDDRDRE